MSDLSLISSEDQIQTLILRKSFLLVPQTLTDLGLDGTRIKRRSEVKWNLPSSRCPRSSRVTEDLIYANQLALGRQMKRLGKHNHRCKAEQTKANKICLQEKYCLILGTRITLWGDGEEQCLTVCISDYCAAQMIILLLYSDLKYIYWSIDQPAETIRSMLF